MPRGDRTGPRGRGKRTGRELGYCSGYDEPGYTKPVGWRNDPYEHSLARRGIRSRGRPIVLGISGHGSFDGDLEISLEGAEELAPLLKSRGVAMQAWDAFNSESGTQKIKGKIGDVKADLTVTHPGPEVYYVKGDLGYKVDRAFTKDELVELYNRLKALL